VSNPCKACASEKASEINAELVAGVPQAKVAKVYAIHESSIARHTKSHLTGSILRESRVANNVGTTDLMEKLVEALDDIHAVRTTALATGNGPLLLRASAASQSLISTLFDRLGEVGDSEAVRLMRDGERLARAVGLATQREPSIGRAVASRLRALGDPDTAAQIVALADYSTRILETKEAK